MGWPNPIRDGIGDCIGHRDGLSQLVIVLPQLQPLLRPLMHAVVAVAAAAADAAAAAVVAAAAGKYCR